MLTAIVIGFALQAFLLALAWRSWTLDGNDDVEDDIEDRRLAAERRRYGSAWTRPPAGPSASARARAAPTQTGGGSEAGRPMNHLAPLPTVVPLFAAALSLLAARWTRVHRAISRRRPDRLARH